MDFRFGTAAALAAAAALLAGAAAAHDDGPQPATPAGKAAGQRHQNFKQVGAAFKSALDESKKGDPDAKAIGASAQKLAALSGQLTTWFPNGSGPGSGAKTDAKADVWSNPQAFAAAAKRLQTESVKLQQLAAAGDGKALKAQVMVVGGACKGCHDKFRVPDKT
jgi:cytochrome c556